MNSKRLFESMQASKDLANWLVNSLTLYRTSAFFARCRWIQEKHIWSAFQYQNEGIVMYRKLQYYSRLFNTSVVDRYGIQGVPQDLYKGPYEIVPRPSVSSK